MYFKVFTSIKALKPLYNSNKEYDKREIINLYFFNIFFQKRDYQRHDIDRPI